jgi:hypothetical protein
MARHEPRERRHQLKERFAESTDGRVALPAAAAEFGLAGWVHQDGFRIYFVWGPEDEFLEYFGWWGSVGDGEFHRRLWAHGVEEELDAPGEFEIAVVEPEVRAAIEATGSYNAGIREVLERRGLWPAAGPTYDRWHACYDVHPYELMETITSEAASAIDPLSPKASFLESKVETALLAAAERLLPKDRLGARRAEFAVPGWTDSLGALDLYIRDTQGELLVSCELKVEDVKWVLWDLFKVVNTHEIPTVDAAFLIVAAREEEWRSSHAYVALFEPPPLACLRWDSAQLISAWPEAWTRLLKGGTARPLRVPDAIEVISIARAPVTAYPGYELRTVAVRPAPGAGQLVFGEDGWPKDA